MRAISLIPERFLSIHLTDICNEKCNFCVVSSPLFSKTEVHDEDVWRFLEAHKSEGYQAVNLHGGEPTIYPRLLELLEYIQLSGYPQVHIQTNARKLKDVDFVKALVDRGVTLFIVSLHSANPEISDALTLTPNSWYETISGIKNIRKLGIEVRTNIVLTSKNYTSLQEYGGLLIDLDVNYANISNLHPVGSAFYSFQSLAPTFSEVKPHLLDLVKVLQAANVTVTLEGFPFCTVGEFTNLQLEARPRDVPLLHKGKVTNNYDDMMDGQRLKHSKKCSVCKFDRVCGGVYREYIGFRGWGEFEPIA